MSFSKDFLWGAATAAPQIEGAWTEDGRTPSIWDIAQKEKIKDGTDCHTACDHYHRWRADVGLMKELGLKSYRFSVSWSRIMPEEGKINPKGIAFYQNLVSELRSNGIEPLVTLYHWDLPIWVLKKGGWLSKKIVAYFVDYTRAVIDALSDQVTYWIPMNEPQCFIMNGYMTGMHAPFKHGYFSLSKLARNCLMAFHASAEVIRQNAKTTPKIGIAMASSAFIPENESIEAIENARRKSFYHLNGTMSNRFWGDPLLKGLSVRAYGIYHIGKQYMLKIQTKLDFIGLNVYSPFLEGWYSKSDDVPKERKNSLGWVNDGRCLYWAIRFFQERYGLPIMITENGMCDDDAVSVDGKIHDEKRTGYMKEYLKSVKRAVDEGLNVVGYQYWSLMDNFEWAEGYTPRFGLIHVDFETQKRTLKDSAFFYRQLIQSNGDQI